VFSNGARDRLSTAELIEHLAEIEESPWGDWYGKTISPQALSKLLKPHRIKTLPVWVDGEKARGYKLEQFADALHRVVGGRGGRDGRSGLVWEAAPTAPTTPTAQGAGQRPLPGDDGFLDYIASVHGAGVITTGEALEREGLHALILRARA
jgi:hypothetical protein